MPRLNDRQFEQPRLFDPPPTLDETPAHQLMPSQFEKRSDVWSHASRSSRWDPDHPEPTHVGTPQAARERSASTGAPFLYKLQVMTPFETSPEKPVSDSYANLAGSFPDEMGSGIEDSGYMEEFAKEQGLEFPGDQEDDWAFDEAMTNLYEAHPPYVGDTGKALHYRNTHEDPGSISAIVPPGGARPWSQAVLSESKDSHRRWAAEYMERVPGATYAMEEHPVARSQGRERYEQARRGR